jgi:hypothetical protein
MNISSLKKWTLLFCLCLPSFVLAESHLSLSARGRTKPQSVNLVGVYGYDFPLWGDPAQKATNPLYGFASIGSRFGGSPTLSGFVQIAPVAPIVFELERSMTQRFSRTPNFPCDSVECRGRIDRTDFSIRGAAAYEEFVFLAGFLWREIQTMQSDQEVMVELEDLVVTPGNHRFVESNLFAGYKVDEKQTFGILYSAGEFKDSARAYQSTYALYRTSWNEYAVAIGAGSYKSDFESLTGFSAIFNVTRQWGQSLSLF